MARLQEYYRDTVVNQLIQQFGYKSDDGSAAYPQDYA